jgi:nickel-dependent lactate racemase
MEIRFPYPGVPSLEIPDANLLGVFGPEEREPPGDAAAIVRAALGAPTGSPPLAELARGRTDILVAVDDSSRPTPVAELLPHVLGELAAGAPEARVQILLALGSHRPMSREEIEVKVGADVAARLPVHNHDWSDPEACVHIGDTAQGVPVWINRRVAQADLVVGIGRIMPIDVCGFTGGGKIVVPGACGKVTNELLHWSRLEVPDAEILGRRDNPVRASIDAMAAKAGLRFVLDVVMDRRRRILAAVSGDPVEAHRCGCEIAREVHAVRLPCEADIVVADSHPFDIDFWQANKALDQAAHLGRGGGALVLVSPCREGFSPAHPGLAGLGYPPEAEIRKRVADGRIASKLVAVHAAQVSRVKARATVILVTAGIPAAEVLRAGLIPAATPVGALAAAFGVAGRDARVAVVRGAAEMLPIVAEGGRA